MGCLNECIALQRNFTWKPWKIWVVSSKLCGVAYVIFQGDDDIVMLFCVSFFVINKHIHENCQTTNMGESKKKQKSNKCFFLRPSFSWGVRTCKKKSGWVQQANEQGGCFFWCWNVHIIFYTPLTWHGYHQYSHQNTIFFRFSFSRNRYGWIFLLLKAFFERILFSQLLWRNTLWHFT